jgi:hypothetical protein
MLNAFISQSNCLVCNHIKLLISKKKQYNEQEVIEKRCLCSGNGYQNLCNVKGNGHQPIFYLCKFWKQTWRFRKF